MARKNPFSNRPKMSSEGFHPSTKFIGGHLPLELAERVTLLALARDILIRSILVSAVDEWLKDTKLEDVLEELTAKSYEAWKLNPTSKKKGSWFKHLDEIRGYLSVRKISPATIEKTVELMEKYRAASRNPAE